jgi:hypothetical protein
MTTATVVIASYESEKIKKAVLQFKKFTVSHHLTNPTNVKQPKSVIKIHGCNGDDLIRKSILITGPLETLTKLPTVQTPKGVVLQFV